MKKLNNIRDALNLINCDLDSNLNCECVNQSPRGSNGVGKTCTFEKGKYGEPWCWIRSSSKHVCTDAKRDNGEDQIMGTTTNWYYSTMPCISK